MKNLALFIFICFLPVFLSAQTPKVSYKSHSGSLTSFDVASKSFGLPDHMFPPRVLKMEEQTIKTKTIQPLQTTTPSLKKIEITTPIDKKALKKKERKARKEAKRKAKEKRKKDKLTQNEKKSEGAFIYETTSSNNAFYLLFLFLGVVAFIAGVLPTNKK